MKTTRTVTGINSRATTGKTPGSYRDEGRASCAIGVCIQACSLTQRIMSKYIPGSAILLFMLVAGCGPATTQRDATSTSQATHRPAAVQAGLCDSFAIPQFAMDTSMAVRLADSLLAAYRHDDANGRFTASAASLAIPNALMMSFESLLPDLDPATQCLGVRIAYGLGEDAQPVFLFGPVAMTRQPSEAGLLSFTLADPQAYYTPAGDRWQGVEPAEAEAAMQRYADRMMKFAAGKLTHVRIDPAMGDASDPSSTFFPFTEIRELILENEALLKQQYDNGKVPSITAVNFRWAAETSGADGTLKQVVMMLPVLDGPEIGETPRPLQLRAADLNSRCPTHCSGGTVSYSRTSTTR